MSTRASSGFGYWAAFETSCLKSSRGFYQRWPARRSTNAARGLQAQPCDGCSSMLRPPPRRRPSASSCASMITHLVKSTARPLPESWAPRAGTGYLSIAGGATHRFLALHGRGARTGPASLRVDLDRSTLTPLWRNLTQAHARYKVVVAPGRLSSVAPRRAGPKCHRRHLRHGLRQNHPHFPKLQKRINWTSERTLSDTGHGTLSPPSWRVLRRRPGLPYTHR